MNEMLALLRNKKMLLAYIIKMIMSSDNNARGLRSMKDRGFSQEGMLEKCIEVTAIQSEQLKHLALVCMLLVQSDKFDFMVAQAAMKMGNPDEVLKAMFDAKINGSK